MISKFQDFVRRNPLAAFFPIAIGFSWSIGIPLAVTAANRVDRPLLPFAMHYLVGYGPMVAALLLTWITDGRAGLRELFARIMKWRVSPIWWLMAASPLIIFAGLAVGQRLLFGRWVEFDLLGQVQFLPDLGWGALILWVITFGFGEEIGWRGYALPRLQKNHGALSATVILSIFLALWHVPAFFYLYDRSILIGWLIGMVAGAVVFTWFYNSSQGSILMVALWHGAFNFITGSQAGEGIIAAILSAVVMVWAVVLVIMFKPADLSRVRKQVFEKGAANAWQNDPVLSR
jgi:membrane protease YdiL (CAAX protease family)